MNEYESLLPQMQKYTCHITPYGFTHVYIYMMLHCLMVLIHIVSYVSIHAKIKCVTVVTSTSCYTFAAFGTEFGSHTADHDIITHYCHYKYSYWLVNRISDYDRVVRYGAVR